MVRCTQDPSYFDMFADTFERVARDSLHTRFKTSFYVTQVDDSKPPVRGAQP